MTAACRVGPNRRTLYTPPSALAYYLVARRVAARYRAPLAIRSIAGTDAMRTRVKNAPPYMTLKSSAELGWSTLLAEFRSYRRSEGSDPVAPMAKIAIVLGGSRNGTVWLKPSGVKYDEYEIASP